MPRVAASGDVLVAGFSGGVSILRRGEAPQVIAVGGTCTGWLNRATGVAVYQALDGPRDEAHGRVETYDIHTGIKTTLVDAGCNELGADGDKFVAWRGGYGLFGSLGYMAAAGNAPTETDGRGAVGPDGTIAIVTNRQSDDGHLQLIAPDGVVTDIPGRPYGVRVLGAGRAIWSGGGIGVDVSGRYPTAVWGILVETPDGNWWVDQTDKGLVAYRSGAREGHLITPGFSVHHDAVYTPDGRIIAGYSTGVGEFPHESVLTEDVRSYPVIDLYAVDIPRIDRALWCGWFYFDNLTGPANVALDVWGDGLIRPTAGGRAVASYVAAEEEQSTPAAMTKAIASVRALRPGLPVVAYWPRHAQDGPVPDCEYVGVEAYFPTSISRRAREEELRRVIERCPRVALILQVYTSNGNQVTDLVSLVPIYGRLLRDFPQIELALAFSDGDGRATGLLDHPEVREPYERLFASVLGPGRYVDVSTTIPTPPVTPPKPPDPPTKPEEPEMPRTKLPPFDYDTYIKHELPEVREAYKRTQGHYPGENVEADGRTGNGTYNWFATEWAAFVTARYMEKWWGGSYWPLKRLVENEEKPDSTRDEDWPQP